MNMAIGHGTPHPITTGRCPEYDARRQEIATNRIVDAYRMPPKPEHLGRVEGELSAIGNAWVEWHRRMRARERAGASCP